MHIVFKFTSIFISIMTRKWVSCFYLKDLNNEIWSYTAVAFIQSFHLSIYHLFRFLNMQFLDDLFHCKIPINHNKNGIYSIFSTHTEQIAVSN